MCNLCAALAAMRETLEYEDTEGKKWHILAVGEGAEGKGKFQIQRSGFLWQDKWIETDSLSESMAKLGADVHAKNHAEENQQYFQECINKLGVQDNEPK